MYRINDSDTRMPIIILGVSYAFKENRAKAIAMFNKALEIQPDHLLAEHTKKLIEAENNPCYKNIERRKHPWKSRAHWIYFPNKVSL